MVVFNSNNSSQMRSDMNQMYLWVRYVYDMSRKYYLSGRDTMIAKLAADSKEHICEIGCGTARNLIKMAKKYPQSNFYGLDISDEMLKTARKSVKRNNLQKSINLSQGDACSFLPKKTFNFEQDFFDKVVFSYILSMVPVWQECIDHALTIIPSGGEIHIVDFTSIKSHPFLIRQFMKPQLKMFHVYFKTGIKGYLQELENSGKGTLSITELSNSRVCYAIFRKS